MGRVGCWKAGAVGLCAAILLTPVAAKADNGGLSFWLPGTFGSLAAAPTVPGWAYSTIYLHLDQSTGGAKNFIKGGSVVVGLNAKADALVQGISYTFATPVLGAQAMVAVFAAPGNVDVGIDARLTGPAGNAISGRVTDSRATVSDVLYQGALKWNQGVHNEMIYVTGNMPSGTYDPNRLSNLSFGFTAVDFGAGYTYLDPKSGHEFSVAGGFTYSGMNNALQYQNGIDFHLDWVPRSSLARPSTSAWPATTSSRSPATPAPARRSVTSRGVLSASAPRSASSCRSPRTTRAI